TADRMRARLASADCPITQILSAYEATRGPVTRTTALLTEADREWALRRSTSAPAQPYDRRRYEEDMMILRAEVEEVYRSDPKLRELRNRRIRREIDARRAHEAAKPRHPYACFLFPE